MIHRTGRYCRCGAPAVVKKEDTREWLCGCCVTKGIIAELDRGEKVTWDNGDVRVMVARQGDGQMSVLVPMPGIVTSVICRN